MSVVSLASAKTRSYTEDSGRGNTSLTQKTTRRVDVRQDIDRRRIIYERSSPHSGRPVTAPQITPLRNNAERIPRERRGRNDAQVTVRKVAYSLDAHSST